VLLFYDEPCNLTRTGIYICGRVSMESIAIYSFTAFLLSSIST
jgi:hypothetical protein